MQEQERSARCDRSARVHLSRTPRRAAYKPIYLRGRQSNRRVLTSPIDQNYFMAVGSHGLQRAQGLGNPFGFI